ncbi:LptF/LptG permease family protein [Anaeromyxobacter soli]|uniref:hypothetical protein n=1 Tax=Anaeromyxobacter soli TaxID=2922725 RepID=UPI001FAE94CC|nr:hypothetical protein [Anaeromyxobacter sp. SG29]
MTTVDDAALELLRSRSGLSIDDEGRFLHLGEPITHARTLDVLWRSLARAPDGRWLVRVGRESAYVAVKETPYTVRGVLQERPDGAPVLLLSDGTREPLDPATLRLGEDGVLRCAVKGGERARFTRAGQVTLGFAIDEDPPGTGRYAITIGGTRWPIRADSR